MHLGLSHGTTTIILGLVQVFFISLVIFFSHTDDTYLTIGIVLLAAILTIVLSRIARFRTGLPDARPD
jgi:hypothetical protein